MTDSTRLINDFLTHLAAVRRLANNTVNAYRRDLATLTEGLAETPIKKVTPLMIRRLIAADRRAHPSSLARRLAAWRMFFDHLIAADHLTHNPARAVMPPKKPACLPKSLTPDEMAAFLTVAKGDSWLTCRDMAIMELFYSSALRLSELAQLNINDIDWNSGLVHVQSGKGGRGRVAPVGQTAQNALQKWLTQRKTTASSRQAALFISRQNTRLGPRAIQQRLAVHAKRQGFDRPISPHVLRHSCASHFLQSSGDLRATQELLGHKNIAATQIYTRLDFQHLASVYDRAHPRDKLSGKKRVSK